MKYKIVNKITGNEYKTLEEIEGLVLDFEQRKKIFRLPMLFSDEFTDLKIMPIEEEKSIKEYTKFILDKHNISYDESDIDNLMFSFGFKYEKGEEDE